MKQGKTLVQLAQELERLSKTARDFLVPVEKLEMQVQPTSGIGPADTAAPGRPVLTFQNGDSHHLPLSGWAHNQLASYTEIPSAYYDRIRSTSPELLARNVNHGLALAKKSEGKRPEARMLRTADGQVRAFLSSKYRRLDSIDLLEAVLPQLIGGEFEVKSAELTERRMYLKALTPKITADVRPGDAVQFGITISSSDVGSGAIKVEPLIYRLVCSNGMISASAIRKSHIGRDMAGDEISELLTDATKELSDQAFYAQIRDVVTAHMRPEIFEREVNRLREAAGLKITNFDLQEVVELTSKRVGITGEATKKSMVAYLANGADGAGLTQWGLVNAFTWAAQQDHVDYDQSIELERAGAKVLELPRKEWTRIAEAVA